MTATEEIIEGLKDIDKYFEVHGADNFRLKLTRAIKFIDKYKDTPVRPKMNFTFEDIYKAIYQILAVTKEQMQIRKRDRSFVRAREIFAHIAYTKMLPKVTVTELGKELHRDHSCITIYIQNVNHYLDIYRTMDTEVYEQILSVLQRKEANGGKEG